MLHVTKAISAVAGVEEAEMVYGTYDIVVKVKVETMEELKQILVHKIRKIEKVLTTQTILVPQKKSPLSNAFSSLVSVRKIEKGFAQEQ